MTIHIGQVKFLKKSLKDNNSKKKTKKVGIINF